MTTYETLTVGNIAAARPATLRVFESVGIDYCCGGKLTLEDACARANITVENIVAMFDAADSAAAGPVRQWNEAPASELIAYIVEKHHRFVRREIPRLEALLAKVNGRHGAAHPELAPIQELFVAVAQELQAHLLKEEQVLFPYIASVEAAARLNQAAPQACFPSVEVPISRMLADHDDAGELIAKIRTLANGYTLPADACQSFTALYRGLEEFEGDLHRHIHLENNILFPRAVALERG
jgi:regulator of cell morphogenesis and NO signaling